MLRIRSIVLAAAAALFVTAPVVAQQQGQPPQREVAVSLTMPEWEQVGVALGKQPFNEVAVLFSKITQQIQKQNNPPPAAVPPAPTEEKK